MGGGETYPIAAKRLLIIILRSVCYTITLKIQYGKVSGTKFILSNLLKKKILLFCTGRISPRGSGSWPGSRGLGGRKNTGASHSEIQLFRRCNPEEFNHVICSLFAADYVTNFTYKKERQEVSKVKASPILLNAFGTFHHFISRS